VEKSDPAFDRTMAQKAAAGGNVLFGNLSESLPEGGKIGSGVA
jgi:hypothetical protein